MTYPLSRRHGFSLVEVTMALGIAAFTLVAIFGLLPIGLNSSAMAVQQTEANAIVCSVLADLRATLPGSAASDRYGIPRPIDPTVAPASPFVRYIDATGRASTTLVPHSDYRLSVSFVAAAHAFAPAEAIVEVTWPASAEPAKTRGHVKIFSALK